MLTVKQKSLKEAREAIKNSEEAFALAQEKNMALDKSVLTLEAAAKV
jgi:hypothetical protein